MQQAIREDVPAFKVASELDLVDRNEGHFRFPRHGLDGADGKAGVRRADLLFTGDESDVLDTDPLDNTSIDLAGQKSERQPDHARPVRDHTFDGEMGLASIRWPQHSVDAAATQDHGLRIQGPLRLPGPRFCIPAPLANTWRRTGAKARRLWQTPQNSSQTLDQNQLSESGTLCERISDESVTPADSVFVHG
jgi:hypothetical protein